MPIQENARRMELAQEFTKRLYRDFGGFVKAAVYFGSSSRHEQTKESDIDVLVIIDDVTIDLEDSTVQAYRIQVMRHVKEVSETLHITSLKLSTFWELLNTGDPVALNILRDGVALIDSGFFDPFKALLERGRIRPSEEAIATYALRAQRSIAQAKSATKRAIIDLFWAAVDITHATLMAKELVPVSPKHLPNMMREISKNHKIFRAKDIRLIEELVGLEKAITHNDISVSASDMERLENQVSSYVGRMKKILPHYTVRK